MPRLLPSHSVARMQLLKITAAAALITASLATTACSGESAQPEAAETPATEATRSPVKFVGEYKAFLQGPDHTDQSGNRLTEAWQVLREDRANVHARGVTQTGDETDALFGDAANRDRIEEMVANGNITDGMARKIVERDVLVRVQLYERDGEPARLDVTVY